MNFTNLLFSYQGRIGRGAFALSTLALFAVNALIAGLLQFLGLPLLAASVTLAICYPTWALSIKRAHDIGKSGWWLLGWTLAPLLATAALVLVAISGMTASMGIAVMLYLSILPLSVISGLTIYKLSFNDGEPGANVYGQTEPFLRKLFASAEDLLPPHVATPTVAPDPRPQAPASPAPATTRATPAKAKPQGFGRRAAIATPIAR